MYVREEKHVVSSSRLLVPPLSSTLAKRVMRRETLAASAAAAKSELDKVRRLSRKEAEERRRDAEAALETQVTRQREALSCRPR